MVEYRINTLGGQSIKIKIKDFYKMLIQGLMIYLLFMAVFSFTIKEMGYLLFLKIFITVLYIFASVFIPITLKIRINKVVRKIFVMDNRIILFANKEYNYLKSDIKVEQVKNRFSGFSRRRKDGILVKAKDGKEFWIVEDFFNDYERLRDMLAEFTG